MILQDKMGSAWSSILLKTLFAPDEEVKFLRRKAKRQVGEGGLPLGFYFLLFTSSHAPLVLLSTLSVSGVAGTHKKQGPGHLHFYP